MSNIKCTKCKWFIKIRKNWSVLSKIIFACKWQDVWYIRPEGSKNLSKNKECNFIMSDKYLKYKKDKIG